MCEIKVSTCMEQPEENKDEELNEIEAMLGVGMILLELLEETELEQLQEATDNYQSPIDRI